MDQRSKRIGFSECYIKKHQKGAWNTEISPCGKVCPFRRGVLGQRAPIAWVTASLRRGTEASSLRHSMGCLTKVQPICVLWYLVSLSFIRSPLLLLVVLDLWRWRKNFLADVLTPDLIKYSGPTPSRWRGTPNHHWLESSHRTWTMWPFSRFWPWFTNESLKRRLWTTEHQSNTSSP